MAAARKSVQAICLALSLDRQVVRRWCKRFLEGGVHSLADRPRTGRPPTFEPKVWQKVATIVVQPPTNFALELPRWSLRELAQFLRRRFGWSVSRSLTRKGDGAKAWLAKHRRVTFVFTPFHGGWLNQVEIWFSILTSKRLRGRLFGSVEELAAAILRFAKRWNREMARPFAWTYTGKVLHA